MYDKDGRITREAAEAVIKAGGSVLLHREAREDERGKTLLAPTQPIVSIADLPPHAYFAKGDPDREVKAKADIEAQMEKLRAELALLNSEAPGSGDVSADGESSAANGAILFDAERAGYAELKAKAKDLGIVGNLPQDVLRERVKTALVAV